MICKKCKARNISMRDYCHKCGALLRETKPTVDITVEKREIELLYKAIVNLFEKYDIYYEDRKILNRTKKELKKYLIIKQK